MIRSLRLKGWKSHENTTLRFGKGTNLLIGPMGAGKTSVLDSICFALFGTFPALKSRKVRLEDVVMARPQKRDKAEVEMAFDAGGKEFTVTRIAGAKGVSEAVLKSDGKIIDAQSQRVTEAVERLLGIDYELFTRAIYSEQNKIDYFTVLGKGERKQQVDELLGIDRFEAARSNATTALNKLKEAKENAQSFLQGTDYENAEKEAARAGEETAAIRNALKKSEELLAGLAKEKHGMETAVGRLEEEERRLRAAEKRLEGTRYALAEKEKEAVEKRKSLKFFLEKNRLGPAEEEARKEIASLKQLQKEIQELRVRAEKAKTALSFIDAEKKKFGGADKKTAEEKIHGLSDAVARGKAEAKKIQDSANECAARAKECENALAALAKESAACPVCDSPLPHDKHASLKKHKHELLEKTRRELNEFSASHKAVETEVEKTSAELEKQKALLTQLQRLDSLDEQGKTAEKELGEASARLAEAQKGFSEEKMRAVEEKLEDVRKCRETIEAEEKAAQLKNEVLRAENDVKGIGAVFDEAKLREARKQVTEFEKQIAGLKAKTAADRALAEEKEKALEEWRKKSEAVGRKRLEISQVDEKTRRLTIFQNALVDAQAVLRGELIDAVNGAVAALWPSIYPYNDYRSIRLRADHEGYALELQALDGFWVGIENASGGEKSCASLALRVAFAMVLAPNLSWLVLDEPTHNLDREAVILLCNALREEIPKIVEQTFIITHDEALREGASARIYRVERDKDAGEQSAVEELG
ncbi:MAG: SMC family ATPase [Candidatus Micrarchaeota archaeon]|nr:SMC family ATPase [Candidatus Micrarchaeota archaeon]